MPLRIIEKFAEQEKVVKSGRGKYKRKQNCFCKIDDFWKNLIRQTIYTFQQNKIAPTRYDFE